MKGSQLRSLSAFDPVTLDEKDTYQHLPPLNGKKDDEYEKKLRIEMRNLMKAFDKAEKSPMKVDRVGRTDLRARSKKPKNHKVTIIVPLKNGEPQRRLVVK